ncbi:MULTISPECIES: hypothetical protein [unclassified Frigoribacterium]|uniref:hypothetical protein n=1 Tax=unclassified Frigoribacterium TaxID=2627005 RepID=UPI0006FB5514|nr:MULTISPECIES: hypothetical protein [unclassified Frigoribacterium]KQO48258.1 hypothetical protein ASF07_13095 [Frigoribacterium sp. Leaf254]KQT40351.1 hypothetical protein ASG28_13100 [Frigoribacterium sp. Leaf415]
MTNLTALMNNATSAHGRTPSDLEVHGDLTRAHRAHKRRRSAFGVTGVAAAGATALAVGLPLTLGTTAATATELVDYTGAQPAGFVVEEIPDGWSLYVSNEGALVLTDDGSTSTDTESVSVEGRILVSLVGGASVPDDVDARPLTLDSGPATSYDLLGADGTPDGTRGVLVPESSDTYLSVQIPSKLHWTDEMTARFVEGLDVTRDAEVSGG